VERTFDTIIVGAGPAGCVLACRLSEDPQRSILLVDAGSDFGSDPHRWPNELLDSSGPVLDEHSWGYAHCADERGRKLALPRGRVFGGCSSVNSCIWLHGSRRDYDHWAEIGNPGWGFDDLKSFFLGAERDPLHPNNPGLHLIDVWRTPAENLSLVDEAILATADELGIARVEDLNSSHHQQPSAGPTPKNLRDGMRLNGALTYLSIARPRANLTLMPDTLVDRVLFHERAVVGIRTADGREVGSREVILSSGAYGSPAILLRSGIGPSDHLQSLGIPVVVDVPGVGENLMDHPYLAPYTSGRTSFILKDEACSGRRAFIQTMIKARSRQVTEEIDLHLYPREQWDEESGRWVLGFGVSLQYARSRGRMRLISSDPNATLDIDHCYFDDPTDLEALTDGVELLDRLVQTGPLSNLLDGPARARATDSSRAGIQEIIRSEVGTTFHPSGSCMMGPASDPMGVVDQEGRVHGVDHLRVVDASIFPTGPRCNLHAPTVAVAERLAVLIRASSRLDK
jgi:choline dehydrogenase